MAHALADVAAPLDRLLPPHPLYRLILFGLAGVCLAVAVLPPLFVNRGLSWERRLYWGGFFTAGVFVALGCLPNWRIGIAFALVDLVLATGTAYLTGPYIKIRGKIYALYVEDSEAERGHEDSAAPGSERPDQNLVPFLGVTAQKAWWMNVFAFAFGVFGLVVAVHASDTPWYLYAFVAGLLVIAPFGIGYGEASWRRPVAYGQRVQFAIIAIITLGFVNVVYLTGYAAGRRWPSRFARSMDYGAHARPPRTTGRPLERSARNSEWPNIARVDPRLTNDEE